ANPENRVLGLVSYAWAGFGAAFGPVMLMSLFWKRSNKWGALAGMVSGGAMVTVILAELLPECQKCPRQRLMVLATLAGFVLMMALDTMV
ncbi:MAG: sodium:proline symporter, partial [Clostridium sp.]|nr:sodium:proline symporter [Clostridium sp.]